MPTQRIREHQAYRPPFNSPDCPHCATPMRFVCSAPHQRFGSLDERRFVCICGATFIDVVARLDLVAPRIIPRSR